MTKDDLDQRIIAAFSQYSKPLKESVYLLGTDEVIGYLCKDKTERRNAFHQGAIIIYYATHSSDDIPYEKKDIAKAIGEIESSRSAEPIFGKPRQQIEVDVAALAHELSNYTGIPTLRLFQDGYPTLPPEGDEFNQAIESAAYLCGRLKAIYQTLKGKAKDEGADSLKEVGKLLKDGLDGISQAYGLRKDEQKWRDLKIEDEMAAINTSLIQIGYGIDIRSSRMPAAYFTGLIANELSNLAETVNGYYGSIGEVGQAQETLALYVATFKDIAKELRAN